MRCSHCHQEKTEAEFHKGQVWCKTCVREYDAARWQRTKDQRREQKRAQRKAVTAWFNEQKSKPCTDCGIQHPPYVMQFDHLPGYEKVYPIADLARSGRKNKLIDEIAKCELVCANCHAVRTHERGQYVKSG